MTSGSHSAVAFNAHVARAWSRRAVAQLKQEREAIDDLNVFPVPDGDTGTNLFFTLRSANAAVDRLPASASLPDVIGAMATGALRGARGNSGLILSVALRGCADALETIEVADSNSLARALMLASSRARRAVADPVEGTMLTVLAAIAEEAQAQAEAGASIPEMLTHCRTVGASALQATTEQLEVLAEADVVDAGATGIIELLSALCEVAGGEPRLTGTGSALGGSTGSGPSTSNQHPRPASSNQRGSNRHPRPAHPASGTAPNRPGVEVVARVEGGSPADTLSQGLSALGGDSLVISEEPSRFRERTSFIVHVHLPDDLSARAAVGLFAEVADVMELRVEPLVEGGHGRGAIDAEGGFGPLMIALARGAGLMYTFAAAGAEVLSLDVKADELAASLWDVIDGNAGRPMILLPNNSIAMGLARDVEARMTSQQQGAETELAVIPARGHVQGLAAAAVFDPAAGFRQLTASMTAAAAGTRQAAVFIAEHPGNSAAGAWREGDALARINGSIRAIDPDPGELSWRLVERLLGAGGEIITLVPGAHCPAALISSLRERLEREYPDLDVSVIDGKQETALLLVGVE
ncbi:DAK2 domain-containing protein [Saxibacter everestensis]|uniref:DAK2 domain-containing protein n=1 Tax=Saxibacter everestensis TaxID=2909229 RepID=A0ABY8QVU0_9MICO|nr:DAK2 domain-containing protein [Brevibacteriaceae bacterium ZFBP1038]